MVIADLRIAILSLIEHRRRALFLGGAIAGVTTLLVLLTALSAGVRTTLVESATTLSTGHVNVGGFYKVTGGTAIPAVTHASEVMATAVAAVPEVDYAVQRGRGWAKLVSTTDTMQAGIHGIDVAREQRFQRVLTITEGSLAKLSEPGTILLFQEQAENLHVKVGDALTISAQTTRGVNNTIDCRVVAIAKNVGMLSKWNVYIPAISLRELYRYRPDTSGAVQLYLREDAVDDLPAVTARLRQALQAAGYRVMEVDDRPFWMKFDAVSRQSWTGQKLEITTWEGELSFLTWTLSAIDGLTYVLILILIAIVIAGIMNTMWIAIRERTREIGTLRAIGMQRLNVVRMLLFESLFLGLLGTGTGAAAGAALATMLTSAHLEIPLAVQLFLMNDELRLIAEPAAVVKAVLMLTAVTSLAALLPTLRAARLRPVDAMRHFG